MNRANDIPYNIRVELKKVYGTTCRICGAEGAEYHHIIPLSWGGTNNIENFLPLCYEHHMIMHGVRAKGATWKNKPKGGRPRKIPENYKEILDKYVHCEIGKKECQELLGIDGASKLTDKVWYTEFLAEREIVEFRNQIDWYLSKGKLEEGMVVGWIKYKGCLPEGQRYFPSF